MRNYREITLLDTSYEIYAMILEKKLKREIEDKDILPETQAGFRKGRSGFDNICILNQATEKELQKKGGTVYEFFVVFKAAFDLINREKLWSTMEKQGLKKILVEKLQEIYRTTRNVIRIEGRETIKFWTEKGLRQGCFLSPTLFALYISDVEEILRKGQDGGLTINWKKYYCSAYPDDVVTVANQEKAPDQVLKRLERYLFYLFI